LTPSYASALSAARDAAASQHYPQAALYLVATPIGNLADISLRALHVLQLVETIACEDTRHTQALLRAYGIEKTSTNLLALHQHNELEAAGQVIERLRQGQRVAYVSDAGTPAISDPGARLVAAVRDTEMVIVPVPGPSSVTTALSVAGIEIANTQEGGFVFAGFLPSRPTERNARIALLAAEPRAIVLLEAPHRIEALAAAVSSLGQRRLTVGRELTKQFEEIATLAAADLVSWLNADSNRSRGEFVLVLHPEVVPPQAGGEERVLKLLLAELPLKTAVKLAADITGASRNVLYQSALAQKNAGPEEPG
jgi:16S rRNA (cytidine1402-2'-O)-methyltransferase